MTTRKSGVTKAKKPNWNIRVCVSDVRLNRSPRVHAEFQIKCMYKVPGATKQILRWEKWRRYSEFDAVQMDIQRQYGFQSENARFPPKKWFGNLDPIFIKKRCSSLNDWFQQLLEVRGVCEFQSPHLSSRAISTLIGFNEVANQIKSPMKSSRVRNGASAAHRRTRSSGNSNAPQHYAHRRTRSSAAPDFREEAHVPRR